MHISIQLNQRYALTKHVSAPVSMRISREPLYFNPLAGRELYIIGLTYIHIWI